MFGRGITNAWAPHFTRSLSPEVVGQRARHAVCPGWVDTNLWRPTPMALAQELAQNRGEARRQAPGKTRHRSGSPELAKRSCFSLGARGYITGVREPRRRRLKSCVIRARRPQRPFRFAARARPPHWRP